MPCCRKTEEAIRLLEENHPKGKVAMAITLGLGTLVRWQRAQSQGDGGRDNRQIVFHLSTRAAAEPVMGTMIGVADLFGSW